MYVMAPSSSLLPQWPEAEDSMLSRKFGRELAHYWSGSLANRFSFLRDDQRFLRTAFAHPSARFLLLENLNPLKDMKREGEGAELTFVRRADVEILTGPDPFAKSEEEMVKEFDSRQTHPLILFLGLDTKQQSAASAAAATGAGEREEPLSYRDYKGTPYFAVDATPRGDLSQKAGSLTEALKAKGLEFPAYKRSMDLPPGEAALYGQARALIDWNTRNPFCAQCGQKTLSVNAGTKRVCPPTDQAAGEERTSTTTTTRTTRPCASREGVSNLSFPRTDPTVIMAVVSADGTKILLGRNKRWPPGIYSTLAGFLEPGESVEEAVRREVWEESGVELDRVVIHSSQPWPFPANLMLGAIAQAAPGQGEKIHLEHDPELEDARWFTFEEVRRALDTNSLHLDQESKPHMQGQLRVPPPTAIANRLMTAVIDGFLQGPTAKM